MSEKKYAGLSSIPERNRKGRALLFAGDEQDGLEELPLASLKPYEGDHPFRRHSEERLRSLADSIAERGLLNPILVRRDGEDYEILAGHNRTEAIRLLGQSSVLCRVLTLNDDEAVLVVVDSNLEQREQLLPSEKAFAYKYRLEALKRQGKRSDLEDKTSGKVCPRIESREQAAEGESARTVSNFIRLTNLNKDLLNRTDEGSLPLTAAVNLSYLTSEEQAILSALLEEDPSLRITLAMSYEMKEASQTDCLDGARLTAILQKSGKPVNHSTRTLRDFGKYIKTATKAKPLSESQSEELLERIRQTTQAYLMGLEDGNV